MADKFLSVGSIKAASTSVSVFFRLCDTTTGAATTGKIAADMTGSYWRQGGVRVAITLTDLAAVNSAYSSGGVKEVDGTNQPGLYRLDLPDGAVGTGADWVVVSIKVAGCQACDVPLALPTYATLSSALFGTVVESEGSYTVQQALSVILAAVAGVTATGGTVLKSPNGVATRITATINGSNERTAMTVTPSS
jgi:VCBS repeat-containing protein